MDDACSLVDAYRRGDTTPREQVEASLAAIEASSLNCFSFVDADRALAEADRADVSLPFGGVPVGIKELESVEGWPATEASLVFRYRKATTTGDSLRRLLGQGGAVPVGLTTASEFGGLNVSVTKLNGVTHNPWQPGRTAGGSSGGSAAAVAGGLVPFATGGDGGGSIRIPAGYTGLLGMKGTYGRIGRGPVVYHRPGTVVLGCLARSVRDVARHYDVCAGTTLRDPWSLPSPGGWEAGLGGCDLAGLRIAVVPALGGVTLEPGVEDHLRERAAALVEATGMVPVEVDVELPNLTAHWAIGNLSTLLADLGNRWPGCAGELTDEIAAGLVIAQTLYNLNTAAVAESLRAEANEVMARAFEQADLVIAATNPGPAFPATSTMSRGSDDPLGRAMAHPVAKAAFRGLMGAVRVAVGAVPKLPDFLLTQATARIPDLVEMGALTIISNVYGNPAVSIPAGEIGGLPIGMQVLARHHADALLLDVALAAEREMGWPKVAPGVAVGGGLRERLVQS